MSPQAKEGSVSKAVSEQLLAVSISQASRMTSLSRGTLRGYERRGILKTVRCGKRVIIPISALEDLVRDGVSHRDSTKKAA